MSKRRGHYVLIQEPRKDAVYVSCRNVDQCLTVVDEEIHNTPKGTRVTMLRSTGGSVLEPLALWQVERKGKARRYRVNPLRVGRDVPPHIAEAIAADLGCSPESIVYE